MKALLAPLLLAASLPAAAQIKPIQVEEYLVQQTPQEQVYLLLMTINGESHSTFPMPDINQCEKEGKRWESTAIDGINSNDKSYYCVKGSK